MKEIKDLLLGYLKKDNKLGCRKLAKKLNNLGYDISFQTIYNIMKEMKEIRK